MQQTEHKHSHLHGACLVYIQAVCAWCWVKLYMTLPMTHGCSSMWLRPVHVCKALTCSALHAGQEFIACTRCVQHLPGYVFAKRDVGLGYHRDCSLDGSDSNADDLGQRVQNSSTTQPNLQPQAPVTKYLLRPRLVSLASVEELD